jgi:hypothetical protein
MFGKLACIALTAASLGACDEKKDGPKPCCEQPTIPPGVAKFRVVAESISGPSDGMKVVLRAALTQPAKRDQVYKPLQILYGHAMAPKPLEPIHVEAWLYSNEADAQGGSDAKAIAKIIKTQSDKGPRCENNVKYDFGEEVERAFIWSTQGEQALAEDMNDTCHIGEKKKVARFDEKFAHKTSYKIDPAAGSVEVTYHYLDMGKDEYVADLKFNSAAASWTEFMTSMFSHAEALKVLTFVGMYKEEPVFKIAVSRPQFDNVLARLQEQIAAHASITFQNIGMGRMNDQKAYKDQETFKSKTYKAAIAKLPKEQVFVSGKLK